VDIVDEQQERPAGGDELEQIADRPVKPPALRARAAGGGGRLPRQDLGEQAEPLGAERRERVGVRELNLERVDDRHERDVMLQLGRAPTNMTKRWAAARSPSTASSRVLPMPASPRTASRRRPPLATASSAPAIASSSASRPYRPSP
jgi:hypothetical protein